MIHAEAQYKSNGDTDADAHSRGSRRNPENMPACCAQSHANTELIGSLRYGIRKDAVQPNSRKKESGN